MKIFLFFFVIVYTFFFNDNIFAQNSGYALQFDGFDDYINAGSSSSLQIMGDITIEAWVKVYAYPDSFKYPYAEIVQRMDHGELEEGNVLFTLAITSSGQLDAYHENANGINNGVFSVKSIPIGIWTHIADVRNVKNKTYQLFINGVGEPPKTYANNPTGGTNTVTYIGSNADTLTFNGIIDEVRIWNTMRTESQIQADMNRPLIGNESNLIAYWKFDEGIGNTTIDATGNGNTGTLINGPVWVSGIYTEIGNGKELSVRINDFLLTQNYPNPFNPTTTISYAVPKTSFVTIKVYDVFGRVVAVLVNKEMKPGSYETTFDGKNLTSGVYLYRMEAGEFILTKKFTLLK